jgi:hypothetical protein
MGKIAMMVAQMTSAICVSRTRMIGTLVAFLFVQSRFIERGFFPYAVMLQVTPVVAVAPLIIILVRDTEVAERARDAQAQQRLQAARAIDPHQVDEARIDAAQADRGIRDFFPYAVMLQVTPVVAVAPLIIILVRDTQIALVIRAEHGREREGDQRHPHRAPQGPQQVRPVLDEGGGDHGRGREQC